MTDAEYLRVMAKQSREAIGHAPEGRDHADRLEKIAARLDDARVVASHGPLEKALQESRVNDEREVVQLPTDTFNELVTYVRGLAGELARAKLTRFLPEGDNHHNAELCPYCNPKGLKFAEPDCAPKMARPVVTDEMVNRFLWWKLPQDFAPDCHISFKLPDPVLNHNPTWPVGTNLFTADQARAMLEHVLGGARVERDPVVGVDLAGQGGDRSVEVRGHRDAAGVLHITEIEGVPTVVQIPTCPDCGQRQDATSGFYCPETRERHPYYAPANDAPKDGKSMNPETRFLLEQLASEAAEVAHITLKALQFGLDEVMPGQSLTNAQRVVGEKLDFDSAFSHLVKRGVLAEPSVLDQAATIVRKRMKVEQYMAFALHGAKHPMLEAPSEVQKP
jgi:hypothetical protein